MRTRASSAWLDVGSPGSHATSFHTCQVLRPRRAVWVLAFTRPSVLPSAFATASAPGITIFARLNGWPVRSPTDASPPSLRTTAHGSGPMWLATPSPYRTCTDYSLPVSRRTAKDCGHYPSASGGGCGRLSRNQRGNSEPVRALGPPDVDANRCGVCLMSFSAAPRQKFFAGRIQTLKDNLASSVAKEPRVE